VGKKFPWAPKCTKLVLESLKMQCVCCLAACNVEVISQHVGGEGITPYILGAPDKVQPHVGAGWDGGRECH